MSTSKAAFLVLACLPALAQAIGPVDNPIGPGNDGAAFSDRRLKPKQYDKNELRAQVDETQSLFDSLAHESRKLDKKAHEDLLKALPSDFNLGDAVSGARKALDKSEELLDIQDAIKAQQAKLASVLDDKAAADKEEQKLLGLQSDLLSTMEDLRKGLTNQQKDLNESATRDYHNWIMVSEGLLRQRREDAEALAAKAAPTPEAPAISADGAPSPLTPSVAPSISSTAKP